MSRIAVVGAGPAGCMAAICAAERGCEAEIFDRGAPLATILRTGGGRCNLTNAASDPRELSESYPRGAKFLLSSLSRFGATQTMEWFESRGLKLVTEDEGRVFPASERAEDVRDFLLRQARGLGIRIRGQAEVTKIERDGDGFVLALAGRATEPHDAVVIATGGDSADLPGSGYWLARSLGHSVTPLAPSLSALRTAESWPGSLAGLSIRGARARASFGGRTVAEERGDLLFTGRGISGPLAFRISSRCAFLPFSARAPMEVSLELAAEWRAAEIEDSLDQELSAHPRRAVASALWRFAPKSLGQALLLSAGVPPEKSSSQVTREERTAIAGRLMAMPLRVVGRESGTEMVTAGGIFLDEVDGRSMQSKLVSGLFFCGEVLDIDGFTGGFNLQAAWSTGHAAGMAAAAQK